MIPLLGLGCGDDAVGTPGGTDGATPPSELYAVVTQVPGDVRTTFIGLIDSLDADVTLDTSQSIERGGSAMAIGVERQDVVFVVDGESPELTRFDIDDEGRFVEGETLSFARFSTITAGASPGNFAFVSETKAYVLDSLNLRFISWNPTTMEIIDDFDVSELGVEGLIGFFGFRNDIRGSELVLGVSHVDVTGPARADSSVVFWDTDTDEIARSVRVENCPRLNHVFVDQDGDVFAATDVFNVARRLAFDDEVPGCSFRIRSGTYEIDQYALFTEQTGGIQGGSIVQQSGSRVYVRVLDESLISPNLTTPAEYAGASIWRWGLLDLETDEPVRVFDELEPRSAVVTPLRIDGNSYSTLWNSSEGTSRLVSLSSDAGPVPGPTAVGIIRNAFRVR